MHLPFFFGGGTLAAVALGLATLGIRGDPSSHLVQTAAWKDQLLTRVFKQAVVGLRQNWQGTPLSHLAVII